MKIWFPSIRTGSGSDVYVERLSKELRKRGIEVVVSWFDHLYEIIPMLLKKVPAPSNVDVIHANSWSAFAFRRAHIPMVVTMHHLVHDRKYAPYRSIAQAVYHNLLIQKYEKKSLHVADKIVAVSQYTAEVTAEFIKSGEITVIYNGIDTDYYSPGPASGFDSHSFNLLFVGSPSRRKGFDFLVRIMEELGSGYQLYYTGKPGGLSSSISRNCISLGKLDEDKLLEAYRSCDALVFPSRYEGFGYVVAEAMACGKPVIAARTSSLPELIENGQNGILCSPDSIDEFVSAIKDIQHKKELAKNIGLNARKCIVDKFALDQMVDKYIELYKSIT
jgi:glycosyltransferase involved in cell wall biosynthesis